MIDVIYDSKIIIDNLEEIMSIIDNTIIDNTIVKTALNMAVYNLLGQRYNNYKLILF